MHKPESVLENEMHKILWAFEIQTDHLGSEFKPVKLRLKIDLVSYPARAEGLENMITSAKKTDFEIMNKKWERKLAV